MDRLSSLRRVRQLLVVGALGVAAAVWTASCQGPDEFFRNGGQLGTGGQVGPTGGGTGTGTGGSATGAGGTVVTGTGGTIVTGTGGVKATGGTPGTGGVIGTGGVYGTGGVVGTGGRPATGGAIGTGGVISTGGVTGTGGIVGTGGATGGGGATAANCAVAIQNAGYTAGSAPACSACKENGSDKSTNCEAVIDCLATHYPCGSSGNCALQCNNSGGADSIVSGCVNAILTAGDCVQP